MFSWFHPRHLLLVLILGTYFFFGLSHLSQFVTADEHYWVYERIPQYWDAVAQGKWKKTLINDKPGVSLALVSGVGYFLHPNAKEHCQERIDRTFDCQTEDTESLYTAFRLPILIINALILLLLFHIIRRFSGDHVALLTVMLTALSPILLGISQIVNPDSLLWSFGAIAIFSFFALLRLKEKKFLFLTALFTALAILAKYVAVILLPFFLAIIIFRFLTDTGDTGSLRTLFRSHLRSYGLLVICSTLIICFFLPALLLDREAATLIVRTIPDKEVLAGIGLFFLFLLFIDTWCLKNRLLFWLRRMLSLFSSLPRLVPLFGLFFVILICGLIIVRNFFPEWPLFTTIAFDLKDLSDARYTTALPNFFESFLLEWNPLVFSLTPITLLGFFMLIIALIRKKMTHHTDIIFSLFFFLLSYTVLLIVSNVLSTPRYSIILYPLFAYLVALGFVSFSEQLHFQFSKYLITLLIFFGSLASLIGAQPFFFNYTNTLLPKNAMIQDAWGYGGYEAAQYLNALPDAKHLTIWADYYGVCEFFSGHCLTAYTFDAALVKPDYYVLTRRGKARYLSRHSRWERLSGLTAYKYYGIQNPDWELLIGNRPGNFVKVVKVTE